MFQKRFSYLILLVWAIPVIGNAQVKDTLLDVYQITMAHDAQKEEGTTYTQEEIEVYENFKKGQVLFTAYAHRDYLHATMQFINSTIWIINYKEDKALQIEGNQAFPVHYKDIFHNKFYDSREPVTDSSNGYGIITLTEDTLTVAGYKCKRAIVSFVPGVLRPSERNITGEVWYSPEVPAFYMPGFDYLPKIPGAALYIYFNMGNNLNLGYKAESVSREKKPLSFFDLPKGVSILYPPAIE